MRKRWMMKATVLGLVALTLGACGGNETTDTSSTAGSNQAAEPGKMPDRPFVYVAQQVVGKIDPAKALDETEMISVVNMYDPLYIPERTGGSMEPTPHLATGYEVSEDGSTYTLTLRDDVTFHSGNPFTADDVVYSMNRMLAIGEGNSWLWEGLFVEDGVKADGTDKVVFELTEPYAPFISSLTQMFVVDSKLLQENEQDGDMGQAFLEENDAGSGPYTLDKWNRETEITFAKFDDYFQGWEDGQVENVEMKFVSEEATVKTLLVSGQADMVHPYLNPTAYTEFSKQSNLVVQEDPSAMIQEMPMNTQKAPTDDVNVRKAIATAFDYETARGQIMNGAAESRGPVPTTLKANSETATVFERDVEKAKEYLAASKYAGQDLEVVFMYLGDVASQRQFSQLITSNLKEIGIDVKLVEATWPQVTEAAADKSKTANITVISDTLKYPHVDSHTYGKYHPSTHGSYRSAAWLDDAAVTEKLEAARLETDEAKQETLYKEAQDLITELAPSIFVANTTHRIAYGDYVNGYEFVPLMGYDISFYHFRTN